MFDASEEDDDDLFGKKVFDPLNGFLNGIK